MNELAKLSGGPSYKQAPLREMSARHMAILGAIAYGINDKPATVQEIAAHYKVQIRYVRHLLTEPLFRAELARQVAAIRAELSPGVVRRIGEIAMGSDNEATAISAGKVILGEEGKAPLVNVNVNQQVGMTIPARYAYKPCSRED